MLALLVGGLPAAPAEAAINAVSITGGSGTATVGTTLYAKQGQTVSISVQTDLAVCKVALSGAHSGVATSPASSTSTTKTWNLGSFTVGSGNETRTVTATSTKFHKNDNTKCNDLSDSPMSASYVADNTGPTITPTVTSGVPNTAGWSNQDVTVNWSGSDTGSGFVPVAAGSTQNPAPNSSTQSTDTNGTTLGSTGVDRVGNTGSGSQLVRLDKTKPNLTVPSSSVTAEAASASGAVVSYSTSAGDVLSGPGSITPSCSQASGSTFPLGDTTVSCSATDVAGNTQTKTFTVKVGDTVGPVFSNVPSIDAVEGDTLGGRIVTWTDPTATDAVSGTRDVTCTPSSGTLFPVGTTPVECSATDAAGNTNTGSFDVIVSDTTAPVLVIPESLVVEATSSAGAEVNYDASADDLVDGEITPSCSPASGALVALGDHDIGCDATDQAGNKAVGSFVASVVDTTEPVFETMSPVEPFEATGPDGAEISYTAPVATDAVSGTITGSCSPAPGTMLGIGSHTITCDASDETGNAAVPLQFTVTVRDTTAPVISGTPANQRIEATGPGGATASFTAPTAEDTFDGSTSVNCDKVSGATFPLGTTTVTCSTVDSTGNRAEVQFTIEVVDTTAPTLIVPVNITVDATSADGAEVPFTASASDTVDPAVSAVCLPQTGSLFPVGTTTVSCDATDTRGNRAAAQTFTVTVKPWLAYSFGGFQRPVDPQPALNRTKAGSAVPVKFSLGGNHGLDIWGSTGPTSGTITCNASAPIEPVEETVTAGSSSLQYDSVSNTYTYVWKTDAKWASTCRQLVLRLKDGTIQRADFNFTK